MQSGHADCCAWLSGASDAPKSTWLAVIAAIPAPEPTPLYCTVYPNALPMAGVQAATRGCTNVLPAPVIVESVLLAVAAAAATRTAAPAAMRIMIRFVMAPASRPPMQTWAADRGRRRYEVVTAAGRVSCASARAAGGR